MCERGRRLIPFLVLCLATAPFSPGAFAAGAAEPSPTSERYYAYDYPSNDAPDAQEVPPEDGGGGSGGGGGGGRNWKGPAIAVGAVALAALGAWLLSEKSHSAETSRSEEPSGDEALRRELLSKGPQFPARFNMSAVGVRGLARGGWPLLVAYEQRGTGSVDLRVSAPGTEILTYHLGVLGPGRHVVELELPPEFGETVRPAAFVVTATEPGQSGATSSNFTLYGIGCGPRAIGSVAVDQILFTPLSVRASAGEQAAFTFYSHSDFDRAAVEFFREQASYDGRRQAFVNSEEIRGGLRENQWIGKAPKRSWDGRDLRRDVSRGAHRLRVRVWDDNGDWLSAWSDSLVDVR